MPCRNRSPSTSRAQSVVIRARLRILTARQESSSSRRDGAAGVGVGIQAAARSPGGGDRSAPLRGPRRANSGRRAGSSAVQIQNGASSQGPSAARSGTGWAELRMRWPGGSRAPPALYTSRNRGRWATQMRQQPGKRLRLAHAALRNLQRLRAPLAFQLMPRLGQAAPRLSVCRARSRTNGQYCPAADRRPGRRPAPATRWPKSASKARSRICRCSKGIGRPEVVQRDRRQPRVGRRAAGHPHGGGLDRIAVDQQVDAHGAVALGQRAQGEILEPHARMKQLRLVPGQKEPVDTAGRSSDVAVRGGPAAGLADQLAAGLLGQLANERPWKSYACC